MANLFGLTMAGLEREMAVLELPAFRGRQLFRWIYRRGVTAFDAMTDLPLPLRERLSSHHEIAVPAVAATQRSGDGTVKYRIELVDGKSVETVYIPDRARNTFCLSTQVGCPLKCSFCFTGTMGLERNLTTAEILGQFYVGVRGLDHVPERSNVVFMGMGEPLLNREAVTDAIGVLSHEHGFAVSPRRITLSTVGLPEELERFAEAAPNVGLAISLHATTDSMRDRIMPVNRAHPIAAVIEAARRLPLPRRRRITFEYVLLDGENDQPADARRLAELLRGIRAKVNLIAYNPWPGSPHRRSTPEATDRFMAFLIDSGLTVSLRRSRGDDVLAACGQLANRD